MFVELTEVQTNSKILINTKHIVDIWPSNNWCGINTTVHNLGNQYYVKESYEEVKKAITGYSDKVAPW